MWERRGKNVLKRLNEYLKERFGQKVYKIALSADVTCPVRDGTIDTRGCIFCSKGGSGDFAEDAGLSVTEQMERAKKRVEKKIKNGKYIAYFQSFTNTYGNLEYLRSIYLEAIKPDDIVALSIATRPDCLSEEVLDLLAEVNSIKPVWVELGLQTIHERSADYIRRGYPLNIYDEAVRNLKERGIEVIVHVILGLPGETEEDMEETVKYVVSSGADGIKLQLLHVLEETDLEKDYLEGKVPVMNLDEYTDLVVKLVKLIPDNVVIHRLTGDGPKRILVAPKWTGDKKKVLNTLNRKLKENGLVSYKNKTRIIH